MAQDKIVIAFDLYGTLLSTDSIAHKLGELFNVGDFKASSIASSWRRYQLEYTWRLNSMGEYKPFSEVTQCSLRHALAEHEIETSTLVVDDLMKSYDALHVFAEVPAALKTLGEKNDSVEVYVFSNGTDEMVGNSIRTSPDLAQHADVFRSLITVEAVQAFKPHKSVYKHLVREVGKEGKQTQVWLVSANPFDVVGAKAAGLKTVWIDRPGLGWVDRLDETRKPSHICVGLDEAVKAILAWEDELQKIETQS